MKNARMLLDFIKEAKTAYHTVEIIKERLIKAGFSELREGDFSAFSKMGESTKMRMSAITIETPTSAGV